MTSFGAKVLGLDKVQAKIDKLQRGILDGQSKAVAEATLLVHEHAVKSLQENGDGKNELRYKPRRWIKVSAPYTPPNSDTGRAVQSIKFDFLRKGLTGRVGTNLRYLAWLEFGTENTQPRPWLSLALKRSAQEVAAIFARNLKRSVDDMGK